MALRALVVHPGPEYSVSDVYDGWVTGLRANGVDVAPMNFNDRLNFYAQARGPFSDEPLFDGRQAARMASVGLKAACYDYWPDVVVIISAFFIPPDFLDVIRSRGHRVVIVHTESPYEDPRQLARAGYADLNVINDPTNIDRFREIAPTIYLPHAYDPERHQSRAPESECASDFCFVGTGFKSRIDFFEAVDWAGVDAAFAGNWQETDESSPIRGFLAHPVDECCPNDQTVRLYSSTKMSANLYRREALHDDCAAGWAMGPREVELAACSVFYLRDPRGEGDELLPMLPTFIGPEDFGEQMRWWLAHDEARETAAMKAREAVADRTFDRHAAEMLRQIEERRA